MILVVGATGLVGSEVCRKLAQRGESVSSSIRGRSRLQRRHSNSGLVEDCA